MKKGAGRPGAIENVSRDAVKREVKNCWLNSKLAARSSKVYLLSATPGDGAPKSRRLFAAARAPRADG
jgi:hypothetical protein